jgi:hypothetical protein
LDGAITKTFLSGRVLDSSSLDNFPFNYWIGYSLGSGEAIRLMKGKKCSITVQEHFSTETLDEHRCPSHNGLFKIILCIIGELKQDRVCFKAI